MLMLVQSRKRILTYSLIFVESKIELWFCLACTCVSNQDLYVAAYLMRCCILTNTDQRQFFKKYIACILPYTCVIFFYHCFIIKEIVNIVKICHLYWYMIWFMGHTHNEKKNTDRTLSVITSNESSFFEN